MRRAHRAEPRRSELARRTRLASSRLALATALATVVAVALAAPAHGAFPYTRPGGDPTDFADLHLGAGQVPDDLGGNEFKFAATPEPGNLLVNARRRVELGGVRGAHVVDEDRGARTAWRQTTGRPDVVIAVLDSGIKWNDAAAMGDLRRKAHLNSGELPRPRNDGPGARSEPGADCSANGPYTNAGADDLNGDRVFNVADYACDGRIDLDDPRRAGPDDVLVPQDLLLAFSDGTDGDGNGFVDDIVGWDFLDDDNDPYDDVQNGHGTGEARDSTAEADNGGEVGSCPNCMFVPLRVGDSFIADINRFAAATIYATDNGAEVIQEALGTLNNTSFARRAVTYAYRHGVTVMASAADEAAQHNNWPSTLPHVIVTNSVTTSDPIPAPAKSYLALNGCTNFNAKITLAIPSTSCSSNAVGLAAGYAGLIYSAALSARDAGALREYPDRAGCERTNGDRCLITPNEVRQILASGRVGGVGQADDVNFAGLPPGGWEPSCSPVPLPGCTSPFGPAGTLKAQVDLNRPSLLGPGVLTTSYPARRGHDQFYGYGRPNLDRATRAVLADPVDPPAARIPPEAEIQAPQWFEQVDPARGTLEVEGEVYARGRPYRCQLLVAPGQYPNQALTTARPRGDFQPLGGNGYCDGATVHDGAEAERLHSGTLGSIDLADLRSRFPAGTDFNGAAPPAGPATANGRLFFAPHAFTFKVVVTTASGPPMAGEDQRSAFLHRDRDLLEGFPKAITAGGEIGPSAPTADGESSPALADLNGDNRNELVFATADGFVHALDAGGAELPGWPVRGDRPGFVSAHAETPAIAGGEVPADLGGAFLASVAVGDADGNGISEVYAADFEGKVYGWSSRGRRILTEESNPAFSGKPLTPFENVREGKLNRTQHGFFGSPVLADLDGDGRRELIAAAMDRHVYAWRTEDRRPRVPGGAPQVEGFPVLVVDPDKVEEVDPATHAVTFEADSGSAAQGAIIDTPAVGDIRGDGRPEIVVGTNEEYEERLNAGNINTASFGILSELGILEPGNGRLYAIKPDGDRDGDPLPGDALAGGWPVRAGLLMMELLPIVGEGITGSPVIGPAGCPLNGGAGNKVGAISAVGPGYILNPDGSSCYGTDPTTGTDIALASDLELSAKIDHPAIPAVGHPAFGRLSGPPDRPAFVAPATGLIRAADLLLPDYQGNGQDFIAAWDPASGQFRLNYPQQVNDLQFLTGPSIADLDGRPGEEIVEGSASQDLVAYDSLGRRLNRRWPKLSTDWTVANPLIGSLGTIDTEGDARKVVISMTRSGYIHAYATEAPSCSPSSWPRFHHDNANSGDYSHDAVAPGRPTDLELDASGGVSFTSPGDDLLCGTPERYEIVTSERPIGTASFDRAEPLPGAPEAAAAGARRTYAPPPEAKRFLGIRAVDERGNVGRVASLRIDRSR